MPTGYTAIIHDEDIQAKDFIMRCARAFGATISMRDEPLSTPIPEEFEESSYYKKDIEKLKKRLIEVKSMSDAEIQKKIDEDYANEVKRIENCINEKTTIKLRVEDLIEKINNWDNICEYNELKKFALSQLQIELDGAISMLDYYEKEMEREKNKVTPNRWLINELEDINEELEYSNKSYNRDVKTIRERNKWIKGLRNDLEKL